MDDGCVIGIVEDFEILAFCSVDDFGSLERDDLLSREITGAPFFRTSSVKDETSPNIEPAPDANVDLDILIVNTTSEIILR